MRDARPASRSFNTGDAPVFWKDQLKSSSWREIFMEFNTSLIECCDLHLFYYSSHRFCSSKPTHEHRMWYQLPCLCP
jgi:hypothetical protein